jgi:ArsR family metal-binding transcriptional regulator
LSTVLAYTLQGHGIIVGGAYPYYTPKARRPEKRLDIPGEPCETSGTYLKSIAVTKVLPCLVEAAMIRVTAQTSIDITDIMPFLNTQMPRATYNHEAKTLTFTDERRLITIYPTKIEMAQIEGIDDAFRVLSKIRDTVNETHKNKGHIQPSNEKRIKHNFLKLYGYLPKTNCCKSISRRPRTFLGY